MGCWSVKRSQQERNLLMSELNTTNASRSPCFTVLTRAQHNRLLSLLDTCGACAWITRGDWSGQQMPYSHSKLEYIFCKHLHADVIPSAPIQLIFHVDLNHPIQSSHSG